MVTFVIVFYLPKENITDIAEIERLKTLILQNGGVIVDFPEVFAFQIQPQRGYKEPTNFVSDFYKDSNVYSSQWIEDSIAQ